MACPTTSKRAPLPRGMIWALFTWGFRWGNSLWRLFRPACLVRSADGKPLWPYAPSSAEAILTWLERPQLEWMDRARSSEQYPPGAEASVAMASFAVANALAPWLGRWWFWMWGFGWARRLVVSSVLGEVRRCWQRDNDADDPYGYGSAAIAEMDRRAGKLWW